jgi:hypothetical protein
MANHPFKHWYAIVDGGCWYIGYYINKNDAQEAAIKELNVHHSKVGYCIVDRKVLEIIFDSIKFSLENDRK